MNERIRLLAEQAEMSANKGDHVDVKLMMEKLAELIVRECIETVAENMYSGFTPSDFCAGADFAYAQAISDIKEHFGVEE